MTPNRFLGRLPRLTPGPALRAPATGPRPTSAGSGPPHGARRRSPSATPTGAMSSPSARSGAWPSPIIRFRCLRGAPVRQGVRFVRPERMLEAHRVGESFRPRRESLLRGYTYQSERQDADVRPAAATRPWALAPTSPLAAGHRGRVHLRQRRHRQLRRYGGGAAARRRRPPRQRRRGVRRAPPGPSRKPLPGGHPHAIIVFVAVSARSG